VSRIYALADLHLSLSGSKPMDVFGEPWIGHVARMQAAWDGSVGAEDWVLLGGDLSWARDLAEAAIDLEWIGRRPGRKLLLRGNHDAWWSGAARVRRALPAGCALLQHDAARIGDWVVVGSRGWTAPDDPQATPDDARVYRRELERLRLSIVDADRRFGRDLPRMALVHYPPCLAGGPDTPVVSLLARAGVRLCVYGHLHGADHALAERGERHGVRFVFVAADAVGFAPVPVAAAELGPVAAERL